MGAIPGKQFLEFRGRRWEEKGNILVKGLRRLGKGYWRVRSKRKVKSEDDLSS